MAGQPQASSAVSLAEVERLHERQLKVRPLRHPGRYVSAAIVLAFLAFIVVSFAHAQIDWSVVKQFLTTETILIGLTNTLLITVLAMLLGLGLGIMFAVMRLSANPVTSAVAWFYVWLFRGTPVLLQLIIWFNLALIWPTIGNSRTVDVISAFTAALLGLGVNEGAYLTEVVRAGILSVDEGQWAAAATLGLSRFQTLRLIVLPQAMRVIIPPVGNETIGMLKLSSLASVISYHELLYQTQLIYFVNEQIIELLFVAAIWYLAATTVLTTIQYYVERYFGRGSQRARPRSTAERVVIRILDSVRGRSSRTAGAK
jgi:polar amino acid transport system permease protein